MDKQKDHQISHRLLEGQEVSLGIKPDHPDHQAGHSRSSHSAPEHTQPMTDSSIHHDYATSRNTHGHVAHGAPKLDLHPRPTSRVSPFRPEPKKRRVRESIKAIRSHRHWHNAKLVVGTVLVFLLIFNSQWFISQFIYFFNRPKPAETVQPKPSTTTQPVQQNLAEVVGPNNEIIIPKIGVTAPLVFINTTNEADVLVALRDGVVHYNGTAVPGENGNAAFFGHSSNDWWEPGNYKFVFVLLEKLTVGDIYEIHYNSRKYVYRVTSTKTVEPNDLSVLNQTPKPTSTLITCTPPGTALKRFVVSAEQIQPAPVESSSTQVTTPVQVSTKNLPSAPPSLWQQIKDVVGSIFGNKPTEEPKPDDTTVNRLPEIKN